MIIFNILGGLGNQMFQYEAGKSLSINKNEEFKIDIRNFKKNFQFKELLMDKNLKISNDIKNSNSVSLHIRRGDYLTNKINSFIILCSADYYKKAISIIFSKITNPVFYFFSDEMEWVKKNFTNNLNIKFVDHNNKPKSHFDFT
jgi:hypothetical protein